MEQRMKIINLFGGPGSGKSTTAAGVFFELKKQGHSVELVQEYAKDLVWDQRFNILEDQIYVFAKQQRRIARLLNHNLDWVITDSPIPLGLCYVKPNTLAACFDELVMRTFDQYHNINFLIERNVPYDPVGRNQKSQAEAEVFDQKILDMLTTHAVNYHSVLGGHTCVPSILRTLGMKVDNQQ
jgi:hypothetical protein